MQPQQKFQDAIADCIAECDAIKLEFNKYSDADNITESDHTQAIGLLHTLRSTTLLVKQINAHSNP